MQAKQYKAFDFISGNTYLIGEFESKAKAEAYCKTQGWATIAQTVVALTDEEYQRAYQNRKDAGEESDRLTAIKATPPKGKPKKPRKKRSQKEYQHDYYMRVTKTKRQERKRAANN